MKKIISFLAFIFSAFLLPLGHGLAQNVGINPTGAAPNTSAGLDVNFTNKGLLIPRVSLTSTADVATIPSPVTSLLVYNTNAAMAGGSIGYWYWNGSAWALLLSSANNGNFILNQTSLQSSANYNISGSGNVQTSFQLQGTNVLFNSGSDVYGNIRVLQNNSSALQDGMYINYNSTGGAAADLRFYANSTNERMRLLASNGYVGIGTSAPNMKLEIFDSGDGITFGRQYDNTHTIQTYIDGQWSNRATYAGGCCNKLLLQPDVGEVAIGTTSAAEKLEVNGNMKFTGWAHLYNGSSNFHIDASPTGSMYLNYYSGSNVFFGNGASGTTGIWTSGGNVGIGNTAPAVKLEISSGNNTEFLRMNRGAGNPFQILFGDNLAGEANVAGVVYFEIGGSESFVMGGHTMPDSDNGRDCGTPAHSWQNVWSYNYPGPSDRRLKENINNTSYGLSDVMKLRPVSYTWKKFPEKGTRIGFIAQEVKEIFPEAVVTGTDADKTMGINYSDLIPVLTKAIQEQQKIIEQQEKKISEIQIALEEIKKTKTIKSYFREII